MLLCDFIVTGWRRGRLVWSLFSHSVVYWHIDEQESPWERVAFRLAMSPAGEKSHHTRKPEICLYPTAGVLLSSWALTKITEIFMLCLLHDSVTALNLLRGTSLHIHGHNFTQPKAMRLNYGETCFLNSCSQPKFAETLIRQTTNRKPFFFFFKKKKKPLK